MEECITEIDARAIYQRLKEKQVSFMDKYYLYDNRKCSYDNFIPSIYDLYKTYRDEIINARMTLNSREFIYSIGKENYLEFILYLGNFYDYFDDLDASDKLFYRQRLQLCVDKMKDNQLMLSKN